MNSSPLSCDCECHGRWQHPCSIEGGCGPHADDVHRCARAGRCSVRETVTDEDGNERTVGAEISIARGTRSHKKAGSCS